MKPRAFVAMPFGVKPVSQSPDGGGETHGVDFDALYDELIAPALRLAGCEPFRADEEPAAGDIRTDMFFELVTADVVVAEISILNPNVFYELGVRHGVAERGIFLLHAGWTRAPFDVAPDRTFKYDGSPFESGVERDAAWRAQVDAEAARLGGVLRAAREVDGQTVGSPVYAALAGLRPVDWSNVQSARAKYFRGVLDDWRARVAVARRNGHAGDILTLAHDAPTREHYRRLMLEAAGALVALQRFEIAEGVLDDLLEMAPGHLGALTMLARVQGRLGRTARAEELAAQVIAARPDDAEALGVLGRIHKDTWRATWSGEPDVDARLRRAAATAARARLAIRSYARAHLRDLDAYYTGINVVGLATLLRHAGAEVEGAEVDGTTVDDLAATVRVAAHRALEAARGSGRGDDAVWPAATLGELELLAGRGSKARDLYAEAVAATGLTLFQLESMLGQLEIYAELGFAADAVAAVRELLEAERGRFGVRRTYGRVAVCSGHMVDEPGRAQPRFPADKEPAVRVRIAEQLAAWELGHGDLALCGGARGADLLFAETALERGADVRVLLALPEGEFRAESLRFADGSGDWERRFDAIRARVELVDQRSRLGESPPGKTAFARNNLWLLDTARVESGDGRFCTLLVWDEQPTGDGPGGTSDFADRVRGRGGPYAIVNPLRV